MIHTKANSLIRHILLLFISALLTAVTFSQSKIDSLFSKIDPQKFAASISKKADQLEEKIVQKSIKTLEKLQKQEEKIYKKQLHTKDSAQAKAKLDEIKSKYAAMKDKLKSPAFPSTAKKYIPLLDSFSTSLKFLDENGMGTKVKDALSKTKLLQDKFDKAEEIKKFIKERREQLRDQLEKLGMVKQLKQFNKELYYYSARLKEYKEIISDPKKLQRKAIQLLANTKAFQNFFRKNSLLASLFRMPGDPNDPAYIASLSGLQTRAQVNNLIQQQIQGAGPNGMQQFRQQVQGAQSQLTQLKSKLGKLGGGSSEDIMPEGFKPNEQKTKGFLKRLELGTTVQTQKATSFFPVTTDLGFSLGYKLNDKSVIGIGASYKLGLGRGWEHIKLSHEGAGLKTFIDWKIKGSFWISGGFEMNYRTAFSDFDQLQDLTAWQQSGLIGISKKIPVKSKFFKKTKVQLLWDFLSQQQMPRTQPLIIRFGYNFN